MYELVLVRAVDGLGQSIVMEIANGAGRRGDPMLGEQLVIGNADVLRPVIFSGEHDLRFP